MNMKDRRVTIPNIQTGLMTRKRNTHSNRKMDPATCQRIQNAKTFKMVQNAKCYKMLKPYQR